MEVDEALGMLGAVGRWQIVYYLMICTTSSFPICVHSLAIIYIGNFFITSDSAVTLTMCALQMLVLLLLLLLLLLPTPTRLRFCLCLLVCQQDN